MTFEEWYKSFDKKSGSDYFVSYYFEDMIKEAWYAGYHEAKKDKEYDT